MSRRKDKNLAREIHTALGYAAIPILERSVEPTAILFRQIVTPTHEILRFFEMTKELGLKPLVLEYSGDKFVGAGNPYKRALGKLPVYQHTGSDGRDMVRYQTIIDFNAFTGKPLADVCCISGMTLKEFHHYLFKMITGLNPKEISYDATEWFQTHGGIAAQYYEPFMMLLIRDCILFENFDMSPHEAPLVTGVVIPAFSAVAERYKMKPLITHLVPQEEESRPYWDMYPKGAAEYL